MRTAFFCEQVTGVEVALPYRRRSQQAILHAGAIRRDVLFSPFVSASKPLRIGPRGMLYTVTRPNGKAENWLLKFCLQGTPRPLTSFS
jgi:hypothetical protein